MRTPRLGECRNAENEAVAQLDQLALLVLDRAPLQIGVVQLAEDLVRRLGHLALHRQQLFFVLAERVRLVAQQLFEQQAELGQLLGGQEPSIVLAGIAMISGRM